jgi:hypothetical protein
MQYPDKNSPVLMMINIYLRKKLKLRECQLVCDDSRLNYGPAIL